jgi:hypothetical protein
VAFRTNKFYKYRVYKVIEDASSFFAVVLFVSRPTYHFSWNRSARILEQSVGARNRVGIVFLYRPFLFASRGGGDGAKSHDSKRACFLFLWFLEVNQNAKGISLISVGEICCLNPLIPGRNMESERRNIKAEKKTPNPAMYLFSFFLVYLKNMYQS